MTAALDLGKGPHAVEYPRLVRRWPRADNINIFLRGYRGQPFSIPLEFIQRSGDNSWKLVLAMMQTLVNEPGSLHYLPTSTSDLAGRPVDTSTPPLAGDFDFIPAVQNFTWKKGPEGARRGRAVIEEEEEDYERSSTSANSSNSGHNSFRESLIYRDSHCLVSDIKYTACQAVHLVPKARLDIYGILNCDSPNDYPYEPPEVFETRMGILLETNLHREYDRYVWSLYHKEGNYYVHVFDPTSITQDRSKYHGK